jgi:diguanylate cyclase (GGDEF)-like protein
MRGSRSQTALTGERTREDRRFDGHDPETAESAGREFGWMATGLVVSYLRQGAADAVAGILSAAGETRSVEQLEDQGVWSSYGQVRRLFESTSAALGGPGALRVVGEAALNLLVAPELVDTVRGTGSPGAYLASLSANLTSVFPVMDLVAEQLADVEWCVAFRFHQGYEPFPEMCSFMSGLAACLPKAFGYDATVDMEGVCQCHGNAWCRLRLSWRPEEIDSASQSAFDARLFGARLGALRRTVGELVSGEGLESVLPRIIAAAGRAVQAPTFILSLDTPSATERALYWEGTDAARAQRIIARLREDPETTRPHVLVAKVASVRAHYGRLLAIRAPGGGFEAVEANLLETYGGLAAAALDSASALDDARRQAETNRTLLDLAGSLVELGTVQDLASRLAAAIPAVVDCDRAFVVIEDPTGGKNRSVASNGYDPDSDARVRATVQRMPQPTVPDDGLVWLDPSDPASPYRTLNQRNGTNLSVTKLMRAGGELIGWITAEVTERPERLRNAPDLAERFQGLAGYAAVAVHNARLVDTIRHQSLTDALTGLPNRSLVLDRVEQMLGRAKRDAVDVALFFIDLDSFKEVNDTFGHHAGDELLKAVAARLASALRTTDTVGRLGGDEFVVLAEGISLAGGPEIVAQRLLDVLAEPFRVDGTRTTVSASIGIAVGGRDEALDLLRDGDIALYAAKAAGKKRYVLFQPEMQDAIRNHHQLKEELRSAIGTDEFFLVYQPIFDLRHMNLLGVEALLRWRHPLRGVVGPDEFIPILEESGMIVEVGRWVLSQACRQARIWHDGGHRLAVSVNVSGRQLENDCLVDDVRRALDRSGLDPQALTVEITETSLMRDTALAISQLATLRKLGIRLAIDDFGTGYSSLAYLQRFPVDCLKIDRSFISGMMASSEGEALIHTLVQLGKTLNLETLAEGIEEPAQLARLQAEECDSGQGFLFARPFAPSEIEQFLQAGPLEVHASRFRAQRSTTGRSGKTTARNANGTMSAPHAPRTLRCRPLRRGRCRDI